MAEVGMDMLENAAFSALFNVGGVTVNSMKPAVLEPLVKEAAVTVSTVASTFAKKIKNSIKKTLYRAAFDWGIGLLGRLIC